MEAKSYTLAELQAMNNDDLNALAAELRGFSNHPLAFSLYDVDANGRSVEVCEKADWQPATDRNQSGELLGHAMERGAEFEISLAAEGCIEFCDARKCWNSFDIDSGLARAETVAFCAAILAMAGRLK